MPTSTQTFPTLYAGSLPPQHEIYRSVRVSADCKTVSRISFVIPVQNNESTIEELVDQIFHEVVELADVEVILVDDGSSDDSWALIQALADIFPENIRGLRMHRPQGSDQAIRAGLEVAQGAVIFTMDGSMKDNPSDIPKMLKKLEEGYDLVVGDERAASLVACDTLTHASQPASAFSRPITKTDPHRNQSGFKCYRRKVAKSIRLLGDLYRVAPWLAGLQGFKATSLSSRRTTRHRAITEFGFKRFLHCAKDIMTLSFQRVPGYRPAHLGNACGIALTSVAIGLCLVATASDPGSVASAGTVLSAIGFAIIAALCVSVGRTAEQISQHLLNQASSEDPIADTAHFACRATCVSPTNQEDQISAIRQRRQSLAV